MLFDTAESSRNRSPHTDFVVSQRIRAHNWLARSDRGNDGVTMAACWSHARRNFYLSCRRLIHHRLARRWRRRTRGGSSGKCDQAVGRPGDRASGEIRRHRRRFFPLWEGAAG
ncbi:hypothetical protein EN779_01260 [Mesorhizobium sp. M4B.F.Ca.ET.088.02.2.1]|nr:hypothetical protein EN779_01260 [Mesorhizobium sp. M4B.F.Ca.ET.088.02.2.1]